MGCWPLGSGLALIALDQVADALRVGFAMAVAGDGIGATGGFDANLRPEHTSGDVHGSNLRHGNGFVVAAKPARFHAAHAQGADDDAGGKNEISLSPAAGREDLGLRLGDGGGPGYTHSSAPFFHTQM